MASGKETGADKLPAALLSTVLELWREEGKEAWIQSQGTSMLPLIREGDRLLISYKLDHVRRGSILLFSQGDKLIAHRLLRVIPGCPRLFITKGDHGWSFDAPVRADNLVGRVIALQKQEHLITLDGAKWQVIGWIIATATLAVALPYGMVRRIKQRWGEDPLPLIHHARRGLHGALKMALKPFVHLHPQAASHLRSQASSQKGWKLENKEDDRGGQS